MEVPPCTDSVSTAEKPAPSEDDSSKQIQDENPTGETTPVPDVRPGMEVNHVKRSASGRVLQHTATDVLVKFEDGKMEWVEIEDLQEKKDVTPPNTETSPEPASIDESLIKEAEAAQNVTLEEVEGSKAVCC